MGGIHGICGLYSFQNHCNYVTFVQPKVLIVGICDQITGPAVRNFMCNNSGQWFIARLMRAKKKTTTEFRFQFQLLSYIEKKNIQLIGKVELTNKVGVIIVKHGFSMPPYGKLGGITNKSYTFQRYGPQISSAWANICDVSENSSAHSSTIPSSAHTFELKMKCNEKAINYLLIQKRKKNKFQFFTFCQVVVRQLRQPQLPIGKLESVPFVRTWFYHFHWTIERRPSMPSIQADAWLQRWM